MEFISKNPAETAIIITNLAASLRGGDLLRLEGELGAGKTTSVKYLAKYFNIGDIITSPTFVIMKNYQLPKVMQGISEIVHMDAYRLHGAPDAESIGLSEYLNRTDVLLIIEWPENIDNVLPSDCKKIKFTHLANDSRKIAPNF